MNKPSNNSDKKIREKIFNSLQHLLTINPKAYRKRMATFVVTLDMTDQISTAPADLVKLKSFDLN